MKSKDKDVDEKFPIAIKARLKHGMLVEALEKRGWNQAQGARFLGITQSKFGLWINMKEKPRNLKDKIMLKLYKLTGRSPDELWPEEVFTPEFLAAPKTLTVIRATSINVLQGYGLIRALPPRPDEAFERTETMEAFRGAALEYLTPLQRQILEARILDNGTLEEVASDFKMHKSRVRQIEVKALEILRKPYKGNRKLQTIGGVVPR